MWGKCHYLVFGPPPVVRSWCSIGNSFYESEKGPPGSARPGASPNMFLIVVGFIVPLVINCYVCSGTGIDSVHMGLESGTMAISIAVAKLFTNGEIVSFFRNNLLFQT